MIINGDSLEVLKHLEDNSVHCCITSPPYWNLRDYQTATWEGGDPKCDHIANSKATKVFGNPAFNENRPSREETKTNGYYYRGVCKKCGANRIDPQIGLEKTPEEYVQKLVVVFHEVKRVLRPDGIFWLNIGDTYVANRSYQVTDNKHVDVGNNKPSQIPPGFKPKDLVEIPSMVALALRADGWYLRSRLPWIKKNPMPESVKDRPATTIEYVFMLTKTDRNFFDMDAVRVPLNHATIKRDKTPRGRRQNGGGSEISLQGMPYTEELGNMQSNTSGRSFRTNDPFFQSFQGMYIEDDELLAMVVNTKGYKLAHFATFPENLVIPLIKAGTSEKGCCPKCGAPWKRLTDVKRTHEQWGGAATKNSQPDDKQAQSFIRDGKPGCTTVKVTTLGWEPTCKCEEKASPPCTVLDPFSGAGTVGVVAHNLGRNYILIDVNEEYCDMAADRILKERNKKNKVKK